MNSIEFSSIRSLSEASNLARKAVFPAATVNLSSLGVRSFVGFAKMVARRFSYSSRTLRFASTAVLETITIYINQVLTSALHSNLLRVEIVTNNLINQNTQVMGA
jgi:hypothetical protein